MKKSIPLIVALALIMAVPSAFAQNTMAMYKLDGDVATAGFQDVDLVEGVGAEEYIGVAVYVKGVDNFNAFAVDFTWDQEKASFDSGMSGIEIDDDAVTINGEDVTLAAEENILGSSLTGVGEVDEDGHYANNFAKLGGSASAADYEFVYFLVLETSSDFSETTGLTVTAKVTISDAGEGNDLGTRYFLVNGGGNSAQDATWGQIKSQFK